jgi:hypothetical protein
MDPMDLRRVVASARDVEIPYEELEAFLASEDDVWTFWMSVGRMVRTRYKQRLTSEASRKFGADSRSVWEDVLSKAVDAELTPFEVRSQMQASKTALEFALALKARTLEKEAAW